MMALIRDHGGRIVFTNGCFDVLHLGHVRLLQHALGFGQCLIVGLNSDESMRRLKGPGRPVFTASQRAEVLHALWCVSAVVEFEGDDCADLIRQLRPDVFVTPPPGVEREKLAASDVAAEIRFIDRWDGGSSSRLIEEIRDGDPPPVDGSGCDECCACECACQSGCELSREPEGWG